MRFKWFTFHYHILSYLYFIGDDDDVLIDLICGQELLVNNRDLEKSLEDTVREENFIKEFIKVIRGATGDL